MVVQHNMQAMNASRMLNITASAQSKSTEKLSSGYRINRAADDAAGLSISEKMRKQIKGLDRASTNAQDGVSAVQTAEGALTEVHSMLQRMNELAVQAANGTNSDSDRKAIQDEIKQLSTEIDRVSETTKFNETYLLKGDGFNTKDVAATTTVNYKDTITGEGTLALGTTTTQITAGVYATKDGVSTQIADDGSNLDTFFEIKDGEIAAKEGYSFYTAAADEAGEFGDQKTGVEVTAASVIGELTIETDLLKDSTGKAVAKEDLQSHFNADGTYKGDLYKNATDGTLTVIGAEQIDNYVEWTRTEATTENTTKKDLSFNLHVGSESDDQNKIAVKIASMDATTLGVKDLSIATEDDATNAIDTISAAIQKVSEQRSALGAIQNRLEHTINNLDNVVENTTAAESRIRDTDMADEMVKYSKNNILTQAGQSMLAQANQATQGVLSLLQ